jgi:Cd2+/Zn2+-exporting ATPase
MKTAHNDHDCDHEHSSCKKEIECSAEHPQAIDSCHGCCGGAEADEAFRANQRTTQVAVPSGYTLTRLRIAQMDCPTEEALIRKKLGDMESVLKLDFNLMQRVLSVVHRDGALMGVEDAIQSLGMTPEAMNIPSDSTSKEQSSNHWRTLCLAGGLALGAEAIQWVSLPEWIAALLAVSAIMISGIGTYKKGWIALRNRNLNINALMSIAVTGAILLRQWPEAAMVMVLFTVAELIEAKSLDRARNAIRSLVQLTPELATVQQASGEWENIPAKSVAIGQIVRVKPGERIAIDGIVTLGRSSVNQAPITGESLPVEKTVGDAVFAGTINESGSFEYRVTAEASNSTLSRIIHAVEEAQGSRAPTQRFVDQFAKVYTPVVFAFAVGLALLGPLLLGGSWHEWIYRGLALLVIACPCALVISTPVTIVSGLAAAARHGILIKGGVYLEEGYKLEWVALDKTGTITHGKPVLTDTVLLDSPDGLDAVRIATSLATRSDHPVSRAIATAGQQAGTNLLTVADFAALPGRGVRGTVDGILYQLGNHRLIHELGGCSSALEAQLG